MAEYSTLAKRYQLICYQILLIIY